MRLALRLLLLLAAGLALFAQPDVPRELVVNVGKSLVIDSPVEIVRVSVADPEVVEAVGISPQEIILNGKKPGQTSVILWQKEAGRLLFDVTVSTGRNLALEAVQEELKQQLEGSDISVAVQGENVFLRGVATDLTTSDRAIAIASVLGKPVNLLRVNVPETEAQVLLKVRFADVDRVATQQLGVNIFSTGATGTVGSISTGQFNPPASQGQAGTIGGFNITDLLNVFLFRPDLDLGATIRLLQQRRMIEILAEPNVLAINGREASFLAGGEYPYPVVQGGGLGVPIVTIQFREFGIRLGFTPNITSRGTIRLLVEPEVSALDFANGLLFQGFNIPALAVRRVSTEIELDDRQSFAIAGLLDNRVTENLTKIPGLGDIPLLGKLFQSRLKEKSKSELLVLVTPEIVRPIPADQPPPAIQFPIPFLEEGATTAPRTPSTEVTGTPQRPALAPVPVEVLIQEKQKEQEDRSRTRGGAGGAGMETGPGAGTVRSSTGGRQ